MVIHEGAIYHVKSRRRREVMLDEDLRAKVHETVAAVREMIEAACIPEPERGRHCEQCSLQNICMPQATEQSVLLFEPLSEDTCTRC